MAPAAAQGAQWGNIPAELRERRQWCLAGPDKSPLMVNGGRASSTNPDTWASFDEVCAAAQERGLEVGYMLHESDPFTCIDLDVKDTTPQAHIDRFQKIVSTFDSYTERSRSGKGAHVWVEGKVGKGRKRDGVEVYSQKRFIICTGDVILPNPIRPQYCLLEILHAEITRGTGLEVELEDDPLGDQAWYVAKVAFEDGGKMGQLFREGNWSEQEYPSQSEADLALVTMLARLTTSNVECWKAFQISALGKREKATRKDYMRGTLIKARTFLADEAARTAHGKEAFEAMYWNQSQTQCAVIGGLTAKPLGAFLREFEAIEFVIDDIYRRGWLYALTGSTGAGKTGIAVTIALCVASGLPVEKYPSQAGPVLYIAGENPDDVRGRFQATLGRGHGQWAPDILHKVQVIPQSFLLADRLDDMEAIIDDLSPVLIIVDTDQAVSLGSGANEVNNAERMAHAKNLRRLTRRRSRPTVVDLCHPNGAASQDSLIPRGGTAFLNEIDGNVCCMAEGTIVTLKSHTSKWRGTAFEMDFRKEEVTIDEVRDKKGRQISMPVFVPIDDETRVMEHVTQSNNKLALLRALSMYPDKNQVSLLEILDWKTTKGEYDKPKISRMMKTMREADPPLLTKNNKLTTQGKREAKRVN